MKIFISEFNEIPPCDESKAAARGRKEVVGPAVYKNIAEFNEKFVPRTVKGAALGVD